MEFREAFQRLRDEMGKVLVGQETIIRSVLTAFFAEGHALLEGAPGLGKTAIVRTLAAAAGLRFSRIQFTPDLMPSDIIGTNLIVEDAHGTKRFRFEPGPVFANILLADEINRATPKTQSALLEAMQEQTRHRGGRTAFDPAPVSCAGHAKSDRNGGHLPAARGATRSIPSQTECRSIQKRTIFMRSSTGQHARHGPRDLDGASGESG